MAVRYIPQMRRAFQIAAWLLLCGIVVLSVVPPDYRVVTNLPQPLEHLAIFLLVGLAFGVGYPRRRRALGVGLFLFAATVELVQVWVPGRHARLSDLIVGLLGLSGGLGLASVRREPRSAVGRSTKRTR